MALGKLLIDLGANIAGFTSDMGRAARIAKKQSERIKNQIDVAMKAVVSSSIAGGAGLVAVAKSTANAGDEIQKLSQRLGSSTEFLSQMRLGTDLTGVSFKTFTTGIQRMTRRLAEAAATGKGEAVPALEALGVSIESIKDLAPEDQFKLLADAMEGIESQGEKVRIAMKLFDTEGVALIQTMQGGSKAINEYQKEADRLGLTISQNAANAAADFNDELTRLNAKVKGLKESIGQSLIPVMTEILKQINSEEITKGAGKVDALQSSMITLYGAVLFVGDAFETMGKLAAISFATIENASKTALGGFDVARKRIVQGLAEFGGLFSDDLAGFAEFVEQDAKDAEQILAETFEEFVNFAKTTGSSIDDEIVGVFDETIEKLADLRAVAAKAGKGVDSTLVKPVKNASTAWSDFNKEAENTKKQLDDLIKDAFDKGKPVLEAFFGVLQQFETPLERQNRIYQEQINSIDAYLELFGEVPGAQEMAAKATERATKAHEEQIEAIEGTLNPLEQLLAELNTEIQLSGNSTEQLRRNDAVRLLMSQGVIKAGDNLKQYAKVIELVVGKLKELEKATGADFSIKIQGFESIIGGLGSIASAIEDASGDLGKSLSGVANGFGQAVNGFASVSETFANSELFQSLGKYAEIANVVGQALSFIDQISGGKLFGTSFETKRTTVGVNVGSSGVDGQIDTLRTKQQSLFRGIKRKTITSELDSEIRAFFDAVRERALEAMQTAARLVGGTVGDLVEGSFTQEFDKDGNLTKSISEFAGRIYEETEQAFAQRFEAENTLAGIGSVFSEVDSIAERWRQDAEKLLEGSRLLLVAGADIQSGIGLFDSLGTVADVIEDMNRAGETLAETYQRVQGSVLLLDDALEIIGQSFDMARLDYVQLAADITDAAGGLEQAASLWQSYFETFYTEQELFEQSLNTAILNRDSLLGNLGLDSDISVEAFRELFEATLPTLSAEAVVEWLRAAEAIGIVVDLEADLNAQREQNAQQLGQLINQINSEIEDMGLSPFASRLKDIRLAFEANMKSARELGATERQLAAIQTLAARQLQQAIRALENDITGALTDLYGTELDQINQQIEALESQQSAIGAVQQASDNLYASQLAAIKNIRGFVDSLLLDENLSPLNPQQQLDEALAQFNEMLGLAQGGDLDALNALPGLAQTLLGFGRDVFASGDAYTDLFDFVTSALNGLGVTASPQDPQQTIIGQNSQMIELLARRNELEEQFDSQARLDAALAIADQIAELVSVTGESFTSLADRLGIPVEAFLNDLGVSLDELTVETATALGETAALLGVEITDLAESVGVALGSLADDQSLLNDALEATIAQLPEGIANDLDAMLTAIEKSTDPEAREEFLRQMTEYINTLPEDQRKLLAPYFDQIDPITEAQQQIDHLAAVEGTNQGIFEEITFLRSESEVDRERMIEAMEASNETQLLMVDLLQQVLDQQAVS